MPDFKVQPFVVTRNEPQSESEARLLQFADRTFLKPWSYPGLYRSKNKELCDLLVVFGNQIFIFSDKEIGFRTELDVDIAWERWYRAAIQESRTNIYRADRWLRYQPDRVFHDVNATQQFHLPLTAPFKVHRIAVANGISKGMRQFYGFSGSLLVSNKRVEEQEISPPFMVGDIGDTRGFIHIFNDEALELLLSVLDTITEFGTYLSVREQLFAVDVSFIAFGEEQLLASYMKFSNRHGRPGFTVHTEPDVLMYGPDLWQTFEKGELYEKHLALKEASYAWDELIELFSNEMFRSSTLENKLRLEQMLRIMALEPRSVRKALSEGLGELANSVTENEVKVKKVCPRGENSPVFVLMVAKPPAGMDEDRFKEIRFNLLANHMKIAKIDFPNNTVFVGVNVGSEGSEKLIIGMHQDFSDWSLEQEEEAKELHKELSRFGPSH